ncbi:MAG: DinB family protein [Pseudomonadota bacterium]
MKRYFEELARYNQWANQRIYSAAAALRLEDYHRELGAFFASVHGTLNHILVGDRIWLKRFTGEGQAPARLDEVMTKDREALREMREREDRRICSFIDVLDDARLHQELVYQNMSGRKFADPFAQLLGHFFNHQTHHRGQAHALLTQLNEQAPSLDLVAMMRE